MENTTQTTGHTPIAPQITIPQASPKPRSEAQIAASRANGAKSKGPVTEEGKAIAALNSTRHGLLAKLTVMEGERTDSFMALSHNLIETFQPTDEHESNLVETMLICMWRRTRALGMETAGLSLLIRKHRDGAGPAANPDTLGDTSTIGFAGISASLAAGNDADARALDLLHRYESRHTRAYNRAVKDLFAYRKLRQTNPSPADLDPAPTPDPEPQPPTLPEVAPPVPAPTSQIQPNEPKPAAATNPHTNHPARRAFKKNRRRK